MEKQGASNSLVVVGAMAPDESSSKPHAQTNESFYVGLSSKINKVSGCFPRSQDRPVFVIPPKDLMEDVEYWSKHALICKFLGIRISMLALEAWIQHSWQVDEDMDIMLAGNNYFLVVFSCMSDRDRVFEGGPYFYNRVGLFVKPWHPRFNSADDLPSRVLVWIRLPRLPLEFWREDILHQIAALHGKLVVFAHQSLDKNVISYAHICVDIDLNKPLSDSLESCLGSSWIQQLDYESLPFHCRVCHDYGHLQRQCPRDFKGNSGSSGESASSSGLKMDNAGKGKAPTDDVGKEKVKTDNVSNGKALVNAPAPDNDGFTPVRS
ncbi:uncharacterized protein LOC131060417 [Cryptomeria japonica]|uniref:uncharacterized protein LOC131060417 n=1 Tax=Cryptomeria japonica TaxID=3369 RepID=UPI0027DA0584|nr:uncharacterized protein LOC131060417 [Cryptomeria japonica]